MAIIHFYRDLQKKCVTIVYKKSCQAYLEQESLDDIKTLFKDHSAALKY